MHFQENLLGSIYGHIDAPGQPKMWLTQELLQFLYVTWRSNLFDQTRSFLLFIYSACFRIFESKGS